MSLFSRVVRDWENEVDEVAARLVEDGVPPFQAMQRAREIVRERRQQAAAERRHRQFKDQLGELLRKNIG